MADNFLFCQVQPFTLAGAGTSIGDTTITLTSFKTIDAVNLAMTDFGTIGFATLEPNNSSQEEQISFTGIVQNANGTATISGVKTVLFKSPYTQTSGLAKSHIGGSKMVISNTAGFYDKLTSKANDEAITGDWTVPTPATGTSIANKAYVDGVALVSAPNMDLTTKGVGEEATAAEINAGTQAGGTSAQLVVNPKFLNDSNYKAFLPTSDEKLALSGTTSPSTTNRFVTQLTAAGYQLFSNLTTPTTLGSSDTLYPSQNAVKVYVDTQIPAVIATKVNWKSGVSTIDLQTAGAAQTIAHGLGRTPIIVMLSTCGLLTNNVSRSDGSYDGVTNTCLWKVAGANSDTSTAFAIKASVDSNNYKTGVVTVDATNITITWSRTGTPNEIEPFIWRVQ